ncbi:hypothetical protein PIB30_062087 [Stylosanthes scabra]|uniref:Uncharacterized protein n=1 Tax=Stylosanthes scabra TaxID=79078 RepID=A0ABU6YNK2_9FABA|nr:hypothetical protein [Stylosanthes scabra]
MVSVIIAPSHASTRAIARDVRQRGTLCKLTVGRVALSPICIFKRAPAHFDLCDRMGPKLNFVGPKQACDRALGPCARAMVCQGKQVASKEKEKMRTPPTRTSSRLAALKAPPPLPSPSSVLKHQAVLATNQENHETTNLELPRATKMRRIARISIKPIQCRFSYRIAKRTAPSKAT